MAAKKETVQMTFANGVNVRVHKDRAERLEAMGFTKSTSRTSKSSD